MAKYLSGKLKNLKVGLDNYSEDKVVLDIVGIVSAKGGLKVGENLTMNADTGSISATSFIGDGSGLEGVVGQGAGVVVKDDNSLVGTAGTINLGTNLVATPVSAGIVTINVTPEIDLVNIGAQTLEVSGISTFKEDLQFISAGSTVAVFDISTGSLGIGSALPVAKLDVKGTIEADALNIPIGVATIGVVTGATYYGDGINLTGIGDTEYIDSASLRVNGITTVGFITATDVWVSGTVTATAFKGTLEGDLIGDVTGDVIGIATTALGLTGSPNIDVSDIVGTALSISGGSIGLGTAGSTIDVISIADDGQLHISAANTTSHYSVSNYDGTMTVLDTTKPSAIGVGGRIVFGSTYYINGATMSGASIGQYKEESPNNGVGEYRHALTFDTRNENGIEERLRIDSKGRLLLRSGAHSSNMNAGGFHNAFQIEGTDASTSSIAIVRNSNDNNPAYLNFGKSRGVGIGSTTPVANDDTLGIIDFTGATGNETFNSFANIRAYADGIPSSGSPGSAPGRLTFFTGLAGDTNPQERLRITSDGKIGIGTTNPQADLQVGTGITMYGNTGIISATTFKGDLDGNAGTATSLATARNIGGVSFDGTADIILPGVNSAGNQSTSSTAAGLSDSPDIDVSNIVGTALSISGGISTVGFLTATDVWVSGTVTATAFKGALTGDVTGTLQTGNQPNITTVGELGSLTVTGDVSIGGTLTYDDVTNIDSVGLVTAREGIHVVSGAGVSIAAGGLNVTAGITTVGFATANDVWVSGTVTATTFKGALEGNATSSTSATSASGLTGSPNIDVSNIVGTALSISGGISTVGFATATDVWVSGISSVGAAITMYGAAGIVSAIKYYGDGSDLSGITADTFGDLSNIVVTGISSLGNVKIETAGIVTAVSGVVTYYGDGSNLTGLVSGITTGIGTFIASAGVGTDIDIFNYTTDDYKTVDYTLHFENVETQAQKLLLMQNNTSVYTNEFAIMYSGSDPIVSIGSSLDGNNIRVLATPETGISGLTTYRWTRHVQ